MKTNAKLMSSGIVLAVALAAAPSFGQSCAQFHNCNTRQVQAPRPAQTQWVAPTPRTPSRQETPQRTVTPENRPYNSGNQGGNRVNPGSNHPNTTTVRPAAATPALRHAMTYNTRPGGVHVNPAYFAVHYGREHTFRYTECGLRVVGAEWYFNFNGGWFGIMGEMPSDWAPGSDYLYIDIGDDGNYYLYDTQYPDLAVQLTFVQNVGDDQAGAQDEQQADSDADQNN